MTKICGIYGIQNTLTGEWYVGQSQDVNKRRTTHFRNLTNQQHENVHLQRSFDKYGKETFIFELLEECDIDSLNECEIKWIAEKDSKENGFNMTYGGDGIRGFHMSDEVREKMSQSRMGHPVSEEHRRKMSIAKSGERHHQWGKPVSEETKKKISDSLKGENCYWFGKKRSQEVKDAVSKANKNRIPVNRKAVQCVETGEVFESIRAAANSVDKNHATLSEALKYGKTCGGYHWKCYEEVMEVA